MSYQEIAKSMIDQLPNDKMIFVINILETLGEMSGVSLCAQLEPNQETLNAIEDLEQGGGTSFSGSTAQLLAALSGDT